MENVIITDMKWINSQLRYTMAILIPPIRTECPDSMGPNILPKRLEAVARLDTD